MTTRPKVHVSELESDTAEVVRGYVKTFRKLRERESAIAQQKKTISGQLLIIVKENGERSLDVDGATVVYTSEYERTNFNRDTAAQALLEAGVSPDVVREAFASAETKTLIAENVQVK